MAWPENLSDIATDLPLEEFTIVMFAIDHDLVEWGKVDLFGGYCHAPFKFNGNNYALNENFEVVTSIMKG